MRTGLVVYAALAFVAGPLAAQQPEHRSPRHRSPAPSLADSLPPERALVRFWARYPEKAWHVGRTGWAIFTAGKCPGVREEQSDATMYMLAGTGVDSLQVADTTSAVAGDTTTRWHPIDLAPIKAKFAGCGPR